MPPGETEWARRKRRERERAEHVAEHGPACQICGTVPKRGGLHQDHAHKAGGETRGWLCHRCNRVMWPFVTIKWLLRAAVYLGATWEDFREYAPSPMTRYERGVQESASQWQKATRP